MTSLNPTSAQNIDNHWLTVMQVPVVLAKAPIILTDDIDLMVSLNTGMVLMPTLSFENKEILLFQVR